MAGVEILLLVIGVVFFIASFFITEQLSPGELSKIGELSNDEIQKVMERELLKVSGQIEDRVEDSMQEALEKSKRFMEKECNEKIMAISEYSDTVMESMNKTHNEIMFLYSMLNDKHTELTQLSSDLQELAIDLERKDEEISNHMAVRAFEDEGKGKQEPLPVESLIQEEHWEERFLSADDTSEVKDFNHSEAVLALYKEGKSGMDIARELSLGLGEVQLVIGLYEGKRRQ